MSDESQVEIIETFEPVDNRPPGASHSEVVNFLVDKGYAKTEKQANWMAIAFIAIVFAISAVFVYIAIVIDPGEEKPIQGERPNYVTNTESVQNGQ